LKSDANGWITLPALKSIAVELLTSAVVSCLATPGVVNEHAFSVDQNTTCCK
jgi:hypothetical protein